MAFSDLLKQELPSKRTVGSFYESGDLDQLAQYTGDQSILDEIQEEGEVNVTIDNEPTIFDEPTVEPEQDTTLVDQMTTATPEDLTPVAEDDMTPEEDANVDNIMNKAATPILLDENSEEELEEFMNSTDMDVAVSEGFLNHGDGEAYMERTIVKLDKKARRDQLYVTAVNAVAQEKKDPLFKKLKLAHAMKRKIQMLLMKKYHAPATRKLKEYLVRARKSKSKAISSASKKITAKKK